MTTGTATETTNPFAADNMEELAGWSSAYHLNLLRPIRDDNQVPINETFALSQREALAQGDLIARAVWSAKEQRREAVRAIVGRVKAERMNLPEVPTIRVAGMEKWEGRVLEVNDDYFTAELIPFDDGAEVIADFSTELLSEDDDIQPGDVVYVTVRTVAGIRGPNRTSAVRMRRLGRWTEAEVAGQRKRARRRLAKLASRFD